MTVRRVAGWLAVVVLLELVTRWVVYALAPAPIEQARSMGADLGGPRFVMVLLVAIALAAALATTVVWLAAVGVRERWELAEVRPRGPRPRVAVRGVVLRAAALTIVGWLAFAGVESVIHLRAGLGFHGLNCLFGPVHRNAMPVVAALAIMASALVSAAGLLVAWMRRTVGRLARPRTSFAVHPIVASLARSGRTRRAPLITGAPTRGPPVFVA